MNMNGKHEVVARISRRGLVFATVLAMALSAAGISRAQSSAKAAPPATAKPAVAAAKDSVHPTPESSSKGSHEGIAIHGHWTIEVKNPNGTLARHLEFENKLCTARDLSFPGLPANTTVLGGDSALAFFLAAVPSVSVSGTALSSNLPQRWTVKLFPTLTAQNLNSGASPSNPCSVGAFSGTPLFDFDTAFDQSSSPEGPLTLAIVNTAAGSPAVQLTGSFVESATSVTIGAVDTEVIIETLVNGLGTRVVTYAPFTATTLPATVTVSQAQSVSVTVQLSFQ
jgi:hypothetical protein